MFIAFHVKHQNSSGSLQLCNAFYSVLLSQQEQFMLVSADRLVPTLYWYTVSKFYLCSSSFLLRSPIPPCPSQAWSELEKVEFYGHHNSLHRSHCVWASTCTVALDDKIKLGRQVSSVWCVCEDEWNPQSVADASGVIDEGNDPRAAAVREMKELIYICRDGAEVS
ncbi:hypothetical protein EJB05_57673 [Eragrostis curvula]|uniref:Uncharacterized protein n=1 Tax=Eragrostis curvula TaxID=38414 RepID=A0A5J9SCT3_9POAL|nr:hypothetical protein EJB05_57673 [Eragrostis curvula]